MLSIAAPSALPEVQAVQAGREREVINPLTVVVLFELLSGLTLSFPLEGKAWRISQATFADML
jgi:hypothetical protein